MKQLQRWGFKWIGHDYGAHAMMADGYWTPWHLAQQALDAALSPQREDTGEYLVDQGYLSGYEWYRNKWIGDHEEMIADLVRCFVPRPPAPTEGVERGLPTREEIAERLWHIDAERCGKRRTVPWSEADDYSRQAFGSYADAVMALIEGRSA